MRKVMTRQQKWQIKQKSLGRCVTCGKKALSACHCRHHLVNARIYTRKYQRVNRYHIPKNKISKKGRLPCDKLVLLYRYKKRIENP